MKNFINKGILFILVLIFFSIISCGLFTEEKCGDEGEMSMTIGNDTQYYCHISSLFRNNSLIFKDSEVLLINFYSLVFDTELSKKEMKQSYINDLDLLNLSKKIKVELPYNYGEEETDEEAPNKYNITGKRKIMLQIPFKGKGTYTSDNVYFVYYVDNDEVSKHIPANEESSIILNLTEFSINTIGEEEQKEPKYEGFSEEFFKTTKKVRLTGKITGSIIIDEEEKRINSVFDFTTLIEIPDDSKVYDLIK